VEEGKQNKSNLEMEMIEVSTKLKEAEVVRKGQEEVINELKCQVENNQELLTAKNSALRDLASEKEERSRREEEAGANMVRQLQALEESESVTVSCYLLLHLVRQLQEEQQDWSSSLMIGHNASLVWFLARGTANTCPDTDLAQALGQQAEAVVSSCKAMMTAGEELGRGDVSASLVKLEELANKVLVSLGQEVDLGDLVAQEMQVMDQQIEEAAARIEQLLEESRRKHTGAQLEVNSKVLDSCTELVGAIRELVMRSKALQREIVEERGLAQGQTDKEFYRKNSRWTEGLISAAKAVGLGAKLLVDAADKIVVGEGKFEEMMVASQEIAGSTAQLVIASRVKAKEGSNAFNELRLASRVVSEATGRVVAVAKDSSATAESVDLDFSQLSAHQSKTLEMETQVHLLKLESEVERERKKLAELRRRHYHGEDPEQ